MEVTSVLPAKTPESVIVDKVILLEELANSRADTRHSIIQYSIPLILINLLPYKHHFY